MQINIYQIIIFLFLIIESATAQEKFSKKELYSVWMAAEEKLDAGQFNDAFVLYKSYPTDPSFMLRTKQIQLIKSIVSEADKFNKRQQFAESLDKLKEYRKLKELGTLRFFEEKIEYCLNQINKGNLSELTTQQRVITGFEFAHRGREKLSKLDTTGAKRDFNNARALGGTRNSILKEQYTEGMRITEELSSWGNKYLNKSNLQAKEEVEALESYRTIGNISIPEIEVKIKVTKAKLDGDNTLLAISKRCDIDLLIQYISVNKENSDKSPVLLSRLAQFSSTRKKIEVLKQNPANQATVKSAFESLLIWTDDFPKDIQENIKNCTTTEYDAYIATLPPSTSDSITSKEMNTANKPKTISDPAPITKSDENEKLKEASVNQKAILNAELVSLEKYAAKYKRKSALIRAGAGLAVAASIATGVILYGSYDDYKSEIDKNNTAFNSWYETEVDGIKNGQGFSPRESYHAKPSSLISFASPGIYAAGAGIIAGGVLWFVGSKSAKEAKRLNKQIEQKRKQMVISPQWNGALHYAGFHLKYQF